MCDGFVVPSACGWRASRWGLRYRSIVAADIDRNSSSTALDTRLWMRPSSLKRINPVVSTNASSNRLFSVRSALPYSRAYFLVISRRAAIDNPLLITSGNYADLLT